MPTALSPHPWGPLSAGPGPTLDQRGSIQLLAAPLRRGVLPSLPAPGACGFPARGHTGVPGLSVGWDPGAQPGAGAGAAGKLRALRKVAAGARHLHR